MLKYVSESQPYDLRSNNQFRLPATVSSFEQNSVMYKVVKMYNELKTRYNVTEDISDFKTKLMKYVKETI